MSYVLGQGVPGMPNRTIYVADADLPILEKAQQLVGGNLSSAIMKALYLFVEQEEARASSDEVITVKVGKGKPYMQKQFRGHLIARRRLSIQNGARMLSITVYQTAKGRFAVYTKNQPDWSSWSQYWSKRSHRRHRDNDIDVDVDVHANVDWSNWQKSQDWSLYYEPDEYRLDVYETLDELKENIPEELYDAIVRYLKGDETEFLDI